MFLRGFGSAVDLFSGLDGIVSVGVQVVKSSGFRRVITYGYKTVNIIDTTTDLVQVSNEIAKEAMGNSYLGYDDALREYTEAVLAANRDNYKTIEISDLVNKLNTGLGNVNSKISTIVYEISHIDDLHQEIYRISTNINSAIPPDYHWVNAKGTETKYLDASLTGADERQIQGDKLVIGLSSASLLLTAGIYGYKAYRKRRPRTKSEFAPTKLEVKIDKLKSRIKQQFSPKVLRRLKITKKVTIVLVKMAGVVGTVFSLRSLILSFKEIEEAKQKLRQGAETAKETSKYLQLAINGCSDEEVDEVARFFNINVDSSVDGQAARDSLKLGLGYLEADSETAVLTILGTESVTEPDSSQSASQDDDIGANVTNLYQLMYRQYNQLHQEIQQAKANPALYEKFHSELETSEQSFIGFQQSLTNFLEQRTIAKTASNSASARSNALHEITNDLDDIYQPLLKIKTELAKVFINLKVAQALVLGTRTLLYEWWLEKNFLEDSQKQKAMVASQLKAFEEYGLSATPEQKSAATQKLQTKIETLISDYEQNFANSGNTTIRTSQIWDRINQDTGMTDRTHWLTQKEVHDEVISMWRGLLTSTTAQEKDQYIRSNASANRDTTLARVSHDLSIPLNDLKSILASQGS